MKSTPFNAAWHLASILVCIALVTGCASVALVSTVIQRVIIQRDGVRVFRLSGENRTAQVLGNLRMGDTLIAYASVQMEVDTLEQYFYVVFDGKEAWLNAGNGTFAKPEYDALAGVCDTKFLLAAAQDSVAWMRALDYVARHSLRRLQTQNETVIEHSVRGKISGSDKDIAFFIKRAPQKDGVYYTVKADGSYSNLNARKCALFIQTGKDERDYQGVDKISASK